MLRFIALQLICLAVLQAQTAVGAKVYQFFNLTESWPNAQLHCEDNGGQLATVHSDAINTHLRSIAVDGQGNPYNGRFWIGLMRDLGVPWDWQWVDGSPLDYTNWYGGGASGDSPQCVHVNNTCDMVCVEFLYSPFDNTQWNDVRCDHLVPFVCEFVKCDTYTTNGECQEDDDCAWHRSKWSKRYRNRHKRRRCKYKCRKTHPSGDERKQCKRDCHKTHPSGECKAKD